MMQVIREKAKGVIAWVIVGMIAVVFTFWGVSGSINTGPSSVLAVVNGVKITSYEVDDYFNRWLRQASMQKDFDINMVNPVLIKQQITRGLVEQQAILSGLRREGFVVSTNTLVENIRQNPSLQENDTFSMERYMMFLSQMNITEQAFEQHQRNELLIQQMQAGIISSNFSLPDQADFVISIRNQQRDFGYAVIPAKNYMDGIQISAEEVQQYYDKNQKEFVIPEMVKLQYIELSIDDLTKKIMIQDDSLREYYAENMQSFSEPDLINIRHVMIEAPADSDLAKGGEAEERIEDIYARIKQGADFAQIAKKESDDTATGEDGGDLGWISRNDDYPQVVYTLEKPGDLTEPVQTDFGWHIFQLIDRKGGSVKDFEQVKEVVRARFKHEAAEKVFVSKGEELANLAFENPGSLSIASEQLDLPIKTTEIFSRAGGSGISKAPNVVQAAFSDEVFLEQNNSDVLRISDDSYVVVRLLEKQPERQEELSVVSTRIKQKLTEQAAQSKVKEVGEELKLALSEGQPPNKASEKYKLSWKTLTNVERDDRKIDQYILQRAFSMAKPTEDKPAVGGFKMQNGDFLVLAVSKITPGKLEDEDDSALQEMILRQIASSEAKQQVSAMQAALVEKAKIEYKD